MSLKVEKNWGEADGELCEQLDFINSYVMHIQNLEKGKKSWFLQMNLQKCVYIPLGVGVAVSPWNFPLSLFGGMIVSAVVTGNTICRKTIFRRSDRCIQIRRTLPESRYSG